MKNRWIPYALILPNIFFLFFFFFIPVIEAFSQAFTDSETGNFSWIHFQDMFDDINFSLALKNTILLAVIIVPLQMILALSMALLLRKTGKQREGFLTIWSIPLAISDLAAGIVWLALLTETGYVNTILFELGFIEKPVGWLNYESPWTLFFSVAIAEIWRSTALVFVILVAGIQSIPKEYKEAGKVFGANSWKRLTRIILPILKPTLQTALLLRTILAFETFAVVIALAGRDIPVLIGEAYYWQFLYQQPGVASAFAVLILLISIVVTVFYIVTLKTKEETIL